jgi:hypothetical protein
MASLRQSDLLSIEDNTLLDRQGKLIATVSKDLGTARLARYSHLFAAAPELLKFLENKVSATLEAFEQTKPKPTLTGYRSYASGHRYPDPPNWVEVAMQVIALAYGEETSIKDDFGLSVSATDDHALEDNQGEAIVLLSKHLNETELYEYLHLFLAAPPLLQIVEAMAKEGLAEIGQEYESGKEFDPLGAATSRFIVPEQLRFICDLVAQAKGAVPFGKSGDTILA